MLFYIYDINNLKMPYILDNRPAMFETRELADRMCHIMNFVMPDRTFIVTCRRGLIPGCRVRISYGNLKNYFGTIIAVERIEKSSRILYDIKCDDGMREYFRDYELQRIWEE
jgi:hypothetical protein